MKYTVRNAGWWRKVGVVLITIVDDTNWSMTSPLLPDLVPLLIVRRTYCYAEAALFPSKHDNFNRIHTAQRCAEFTAAIAYTLRCVNEIGNIIVLSIALL